MTKIVYNACFGGFSISDAAIKRYAEIKGIKLYPETGKFDHVTYWTVPEDRRPGELEGEAWRNATQEQRIAHNKSYGDHTIGSREFERNDPVLVQVVEELGDAANGMCAKLRIAELAPGTPYRIDEYDGSETVATLDSYEWKTA